jgi:hypothetical protein
MTDSRVVWPWRGRESGQALVETALIVPLLFLLLLGAVELGRVTYAAIELTNAARAGTQYAAMNGGGYMDSAGIAIAAQNDAYNIYNIHPTSFSVTSSYSCSCSGGGTPSCAPPDPPTGCTTSHLIVTVTVATQATFDPLIHLPVFGSNTFTLHGRAIQKVLQ